MSKVSEYCYTHDMTQEDFEERALASLKLYDDILTSETRHMMMRYAENHDPYMLNTVIRNAIRDAER